MYIRMAGLQYEISPCLPMHSGKYTRPVCGEGDEMWEYSLTFTKEH